MAAKKQEAVTASFHYLCQVRVEGRREVQVPFTADDFTHLVQQLVDKPPLDENDADALDRVRLRQDAPITDIEIVNNETVFGRFQASYWGHAYRNTHKGEIPAESVNLRPFFFLLYISRKGRIYISAQYLGTYGGYGALEQTIRRYLPKTHRVESHSYILNGSYYKNVKPKEFQVTLVDRNIDLAAKNTMGRKTVVALKKSSKGDGFEDEATKRIMPLIGKPQDEVRKAVADIIKDSTLIDVNDADIEDCTVLASTTGRNTTTIHILEPGNHATRFPVEARIGFDGHPDRGEARACMLEVLENEIIARE